MKKSIITIFILVATLLIGIVIGRFTSPVKEKLVEKEVEVQSPTAGLTKKYLSKFIDIQEEVNKLPRDDEQYQTTIGMRELASQEYEMWDTLLNEIYSELKNTLSTEDMDKLTALQIQWISDRDATAEAAGQKAEGGTLQPLLITSSKSQTTKERCLELIKDYMS
ncbi:lysozyme inhibitor LprI family protein [Clostridium nigeriense]|uniref:lysozyme inhibitor LprI family protein n=1 Tax=Clostridium nigeriense TaxID=1805470 RepID=UPI003D33C27C